MSALDELLKHSPSNLQAEAIAEHEALRARIAELEAENAELKQWLEEARGNTSAWSSPPNY